MGDSRIVPSAGFTIRFIARNGARLGTARSSQVRLAWISPGSDEPQVSATASREKRALSLKALLSLADSNVRRTTRESQRLADERRRCGDAEGLRPERGDE